ncbi:MAG: hypothetical protein IPK33_33360 [Gemmatimonadetes bacterium]|nr:hypothetical protein [Gemmatimonadota bacterium]
MRPFHSVTDVTMRALPLGRRSRSSASCRSYSRTASPGSKAPRTVTPLAPIWMSGASDTTLMKPPCMPPARISASVFITKSSPAYCGAPW